MLQRALRLKLHLPCVLTVMLEEQQGDFLFAVVCSLHQQQLAGTHRYEHIFAGRAFNVTQQAPDVSHCNMFPAA